MEKSMETKLKDNMFISCFAGYKLLELERQCDKEDDNDLLWRLIDCGYDRSFARMEGRCSLSSSVSFSMEEWENDIDSDAKRLVEIVKNEKIESFMSDEQKEVFNRMVLI